MNLVKLFAVGVDEKRKERRARRNVERAIAFVVESLECRRHLAVHEWDIPSVDTWTGQAPTFVTLLPGQDLGQVRAFLNGNTSGNPDHLFLTAR